MFTGLIEETGRVASVRDSIDGREITVSASVVLQGLKQGDSIALNGACQTVTAFSDAGFTAFASKITCNLTNLGDLKAGDRINLERAATPSSRLGGHMVQGHVDGTGSLSHVQKDTRGLSLKIASPPEILRYIVDRGSVSVDGISLTVVKKERAGFSLYIIPETITSTTVSEWIPGRRINLEADIIARYVENFLNSGKEGGGDERLMESLRENGYL